jgi:hypothetical protein
MKLSAAFGDISALRTKSFELGGHKFKVRIPLSKELEVITERTNQVDPAKYEERFARLTKGMEVVDGDVMVDGRSTKELVETAIRFENRTVEFFKLLVADSGDLNDLTYEDIESEMPLTVQIEMINAIGDAIQPSFGESRKNS